VQTNQSGQATRPLFGMHTTIQSCLHVIHYPTYLWNVGWLWGSCLRTHNYNVPKGRNLRCPIPDHHAKCNFPTNWHQKEDLELSMPVHSVNKKVEKIVEKWVKKKIKSVL
jgi:hypothetical protein